MVLENTKWETKLQLRYLLYGHTERVYELQGRLEELRGDERIETLDLGSYAAKRRASACFRVFTLEAK